MTNPALALVSTPPGSLHSDAGKVIAGMVSLYDALKFLNTLCKNLGVQVYVMSRVPNLDRGVSGAVMATNCQSGFLGEIDRLKLVDNSSLLEKLRQTTQPFSWDVSRCDWQGSKHWQLQAAQIFVGYRIRQGICFPWYSNQGLTGILTFMGESIELDHETQCSLQIITLRLFEQFRDSQFAVPDNALGLTRREKDCLKWTSEGKTSADIAQIIEISEHTVNHYLTCAIRKMDAVNRTQAVVKALKSGEID